MVVDIAFEHIQKRRREGEEIFDRSRIETAILKAATECGGFQRFLLPEAALGRGFMLDYRERSDQEIAHSLTDKVILSLNENQHLSLERSSLPKHPSPFYMPDIEEVQDSVIYTLWHSGFVDIGDAYLRYRSERALVREGTLKEEQLPVSGFPNRDFRNSIIELYKNIGCSSVEEVNKMLADEKLFIDLIHFFCEYYDRQLEDAFQKFQEKADDVRLIIIAGKSSSGKTTTAHKFCYERKGAIKKELVPLEVDMYFKTQQPKNARGDINYELPESLDLLLLKHHLESIFDGKPTQTPHYDFSKGIRHDNGGKIIELDKNKVLVIDSHNGLYPTILESVPPEQRFAIYLQPWNIQTSEGEDIPCSFNNMLFRIGRDIRTRNTGYVFNIPHWMTVRLGELRDIKPRMNLADVTINSGIPFFFHFMKRYMTGEIAVPEPEMFLGRGQVYAAERAYRIQKIFKNVTAVPERFMDKAVLPDNTVLRECIGGSRYSAH